MLHFGNASWLASRDPELQDKAVKFLDLLASSVVFSTTIDMTAVLSRMAREGWTLHASDLAVLSPYRRDNVLRFGDYTTDQLHIPPPRCVGQKQERLSVVSENDSRLAALRMSVRSRNGWRPRFVVSGLVLDRRVRP